MASAAYLALLERASVPWIVLCELTAREDVRGWTAASGGTYVATIEVQTHPASIRLDRGLYRPVVGVYENETPLDAAASLAALEAGTGGEYFWSEGSTLLYVKPTFAGDPDALSLMQVAFLVRLSTAPIAFDGVPPYDAQLDLAALPVVRFDRPEILRGVTSYPVGDVSFVNADGFWDYPAAAWNWSNAVVAFYAGAEGLDRSDFELVATMLAVQEPSAGDEVALLQLRSRSDSVDVALPLNTIRDFYGSAATLLSGGDPSMFLPIAYGDIVDAPLVFIYDAGARNKWSPVDPFVSSGLTIASISAVNRSTGARTLLVGGLVDYVVGFGDGSVEVDKSWDKDTYDLLWTGHSSIRTCGAIASALLSLAGVPSSEIDATAFAQADIDNPARLSIFVGGGADVSVFVSVVDLLNQIERSTLSSIYQGADGRWTMRVWDPSIDLDQIDERLADSAFSEWRPVAFVTEPVAPAVSVRYGYVAYSQAWQETNKSRTEDRARLLSGGRETVDSVLSNAGDAEILAARLQAIAATPTRRVEVQDGPAGMGLVSDDKLRIIRSRGASLTGSVDAVFEVESVVRRIATMTVDVTLGNLRGLGMMVKVAAADGTAGWDSATGNERLQYAYAADDATEQVDTSDASTYRQAGTW